MERIKGQISIQWNFSYGEFVDLDQPCECAYLEPDIDDKRDPNPTCSECGGSGFVLTEAGRAVMDLIKRHLLK